MQIPAGLEQHEGFAGLADSVGANLGAWRAYYDAAKPEFEPLPEPWQSELDSFQRMNLLRIIRPDAAVSSVQSFVAERMAQRYIEPPPFDLVRPPSPASYLNYA